MLPVIDTPSNMTPHIARLKANGVTTVIRYYNNQNSTSFPSKRLDLPEATALSDAGLGMAVVFEQRGGAGGNIGDLSGANGTRDAQRALALAAALGQPHGSAIYFAVDHDYFRSSELAAIVPYFQNARNLLGNTYRMGVYGSGTVGGRLLDLGLVDLVWLAGAMGWSGTRDMLSTDRWAIFQKDLEKQESGFGYDGNVVSPAHPDFGQFRLGAIAMPAAAPGAAPAAAPAVAPAVAPVATPPMALMEVIARSGLNLRRGPDTSFSEIRTLPRGTVVRALGRTGAWVKVDLEGDGVADGFMHGDYLSSVAGGLPLPVAAGDRPIDIARAELAAGIAEAPGTANNPRVLLYHATTTLHATSDSVAWCSSFVNYCVTQSGRRGTDSAAARSWHDAGWGQDVTNAPAVGDIAVFSRTGGGAGAGSGHVGFWLGDTGSGIEVLGGNQGDRVSIGTYPKNGVLAPFTYRLLSIRRG